jgi:hypothetical protein
MSAAMIFQVARLRRRPSRSQPSWGAPRKSVAEDSAGWRLKELGPR